MLTNQQMIAAIAWAARIRGTSYGMLESKLTRLERERIYKRYERHLEENGKQKTKDKQGR